ERVAAGRARRGRRARGPGDPRRRGRHGAGRAGVARPGLSLGRDYAGAAMTLDPVGLEVMGHAFASIAEEMGLVLIHSALSPNIRERRDCSAALFDPDGEMIAQAAHIPVHLGALAESVAAVRSLDPRPGDVAAQRAAVERGGEGLRALVALYGRDAAGAAARDLIEYAERRTRAALAKVAATGLWATDWLEGDGVDDVDLPITVRVDIRE